MKTIKSLDTVNIEVARSLYATGKEIFWKEDGSDTFHKVKKNTELYDFPRRAYYTETL